MPRRRPFLTAVWVVAVLWAGVFAPSHADQPTPFPSPTPSVVPSGPVPASVTPQPTNLGGPQSNPFPSPTAVEQPPARNGYVAAGYVGGSASGGQIAPLPNSTSTPVAFPSSSAGGFWLDLLGRLGPSYLAQILYDNFNVHGGDNPLVSYAQGRFEYEPSPRVAFGLAMVSVQRSTSTANMNAFGVGGSLLPDLRGGLTPYASLFVYPHIQTGGVAATFTSADAGVLYVPQKRGGLFFRVGGSLRAGLPATTSPSSVTALQLGLGTAF